MNVDEAKFIRHEVSNGNLRVEDFIAAEAKGFLECHERYKPLVEALELPTWTDAVFLVQDVGMFSFWGNIVDAKTGQVRVYGEIEEIEKPWIKADTESVLESILVFKKLK